MKVFETSIKFEQYGKWSEREADTKGYLIKRNDDDDIVEGYVEMQYPTNYDSVRFIKGLYSKKSLVFMQMSNENRLSPICYCFPNVKEEGYWSDFSTKLGFFPIWNGTPCSQGHATISIKEITDASVKDVEEKTTAIFAEKVKNATSMNRDLMADAKSLTDFLDSAMIFQMKIHCGKW